MCVQVCLTPGTVSKMWLLYVLGTTCLLLTINYGSSSFHVMIWEPSSVLWSFFRWAMSDLREGQRRLHSRDTYVRKKKRNQEKAVYSRMHRYILEFCYKNKSGSKHWQ